MNILLIAPASGQWHKVGLGRLLNGKTFRFSLLSLLSVAAQTPKQHNITIVDEQIDDIPWNQRFDLVGITCMTALAPRAYEIARWFRAQGIPVVLGGFHPTLCPDEALRYADAVVAGDVEGVWDKVLDDVKQDRLKGIYRAEQRKNAFETPAPRFDLLAMNQYATYAVQATRGCNHHCSFCSVSAFHGHQQRFRPIEHVVEEIKHIPSEFFIFVDDNLMGDRDYARRLLEAIAPLNKKWITQSTLAIADDGDLLHQTAQAGCVGVFVGIETFSESNLQSVDKGFHQVERYREAIERFHAAGIGVEAGIVFGFDRDRADVFRHTLDTMDELAIDAAQISILTPMPGTALYRQMQPRIFDRDWSHYDFHHAVFQPSQMPARPLQLGHDWITRQFYSPKRITRRMLRWIQQPNGLATLKYAASINLAYYGRIQSWGIGYGIHPRDFEDMNAPMSKEKAA